MNERWKDSPDEHDFPAALNYLSLCFRAKVARELVKELRGATDSESFEAKDLLRASGLALLDKDNVHVAKDLQKIHNHQKLSPVLLVRGDATRGLPLIIADGYHRTCASYLTDEDALIPCRIVNRP